VSYPDNLQKKSPPFAVMIGSIPLWLWRIGSYIVNKCRSEKMTPHMDSEGSIIITVDKEQQ
jgi:hypothetical protein